jgi:Ca-activated chloride channel family protein
MSRLSEHEIARQLAEREDFEPPAGLLEKIKNEIPPSITVGPAVLPEERRRPMPFTQRWLIAASLIAMVGAGLFAVRLQKEARPLAAREEATEQAPAAAPSPDSIPAGAPEPEAPQTLSDADAKVPASPKAAPLTEQQKNELKSLGYLDHESAQPVEVPATPPSAYAPAPPPPPPPVTWAKPAVRAEVAAQEMEGGVEGGVSGGVAGGVVGGVVGGVAGGAPGGVPAESPSEARRIKTGSTVSQSELSKIPTARDPSPSAAPGQPYADVLYRTAGVNPFVKTDEDRLSTFGLDVDTASYTVARRYLADGNLPDPKSVRVEEYVNFFSYGDPAPRGGDFALKAEGGPTPFVQSPSHRLLRFNIRGREMRADNRRPVVLTFVIDVSGSMEQENRLGLVKKSLALLLDQLRPTDRVGLVVFGDRARILQEPTNDREAVRRAIDALASEGSTNTEEGLTVGYDVAGRSFRANAANRVILCSDGVANVGAAGPYAILGRIGREARRGIELTTLGFGMGNYNDHLMEQLADKGDGRYAYIDTLDEARRVLVEELTGTLMTIAKDAKVQVEFNPAVVARYRLLGYENRAIADERFRDDTVDAGEVGAGHSVTALYEVELKPEAPRDGLIATLRLRYRSPELGNQTETARKLYVNELAPTWESATASFRLAALVGQFAEILKGSPWAKGNLGEVARHLRTVETQIPKSGKASEKASELMGLVEKAARIKGGGLEEE